ncbi:hypothetical protein C770_GR4pC0230 (plasmid) [Sinorhizobium meliloti GR4]|nr:hypothetical protein C770_GR4pC0230 [Sinorhizobium meliloti GR4]
MAVTRAIQKLSDRQSGVCHLSLSLVYENVRE